MTLLKQYIQDQYKRQENISLYCCGPTTYERMHIGNIKTLYNFFVIGNIYKIFFDNVQTIVNITDVDDKIINKSIELDMPFSVVSTLYVKKFLSDIKTFNINFDCIPKVTENIAGIVEYIDFLIHSGYAYYDNNSVFCNTKNNLYNHMKNKKFSSENKDFVLWKNMKINDVFWSSKYGLGRPGWHIECAYFIEQYAKYKIFLHFGGEDLIFPHHYNEEYLIHIKNKNNLPLVWQHSALVIDKFGKKMSKKHGNTIDIYEVPNLHALKAYFLNASIKSKFMFSWDVYWIFLEKIQQIKKHIDVCTNETTVNRYHITHQALSYLYDFEKQQHKMSFSGYIDFLLKQIKKYKTDRELFMALLAIVGIVNV